MSAPNDFERAARQRHEEALLRNERLVKRLAGFLKTEVTPLVELLVMKVGGTVTNRVFGDWGMMIVFTLPNGKGLELRVLKAGESMGAMIDMIAKTASGGDPVDSQRIDLELILTKQGANPVASFFYLDRLYRSTVPCRWADIGPNRTDDHVLTWLQMELKKVAELCAG